MDTVRCFVRYCLRCQQCRTFFAQSMWVVSGIICDVSITRVLPDLFAVFIWVVPEHFAVSICDLSEIYSGVYMGNARYLFEVFCGKAIYAGNAGDVSVASRCSTFYIYLPITLASFRKTQILF